MSTRANLGRAWEARLLAWHHAYKQAGQAFVVQAPPPVKMISRPVKGRFMAAHMKEGPPDFVGVALGRAVCFDAKHTESSRWPLQDLQPHQARDLVAADRAGAFAFVALEIGGEGWILPWSALGPAWVAWATGRARRGEASLSPDDIAALGLRMDPDEGWLPAARHLLEARAA